MKKIKFIRHSKPAEPYTDYTKLSFSEICDLATGHFTPNINPETPQLILSKISPLKLQQYDLLLCSTSKRTRQTAKEIKKILNKDIKIRETSNLDEIVFNPAELTSEVKFKKHGFKEIRRSLFEGVLSRKHAAESIVSIMERIKDLELELKNDSHTNILCVTHSFYMRFLRLYFLEDIRKGDKITVKKLMNTTDHSYIEGFNIALKV